MRILSWFGAFVIFAAVAVGTTAVVRSHQHSGPALTAAVAAGPVVPAGTGAPPHSLPRPTSARKPRRASAPRPAPQSAPVTRPVLAPSIVVGPYRRLLS